jgi:hypothetical protein
MLPSLGKLRITEPTAGLEALQFWSLPNGKAAEMEEHRKSTSDLLSMRMPSRQASERGMAVRDKEWLEEFVVALRDTEARAGDDLRVMWRASVISQMNYKVGYYGERHTKLKARADDEKERLHRMARSYTDGLDPLYQVTARDGGNSTWEILKDGKTKMYDAYVQISSDANKIKDAAAAKRDTFLTASAGGVPSGSRPGVRGDASSVRFNALCDKLATAIEDLYTTYPSQDDLLDTMASYIGAFVENPAITRKKSFNFIVTGNAGVGKTKLASMMGAVLGALGVYVYDDVMTISRSDLVAEYEGQTAPLAKQTLANGLERVQFLDEAYAITVFEQKPDGRRVHNAYSNECIVELLTHLEGQKGNTTFIAAGYADKMKDPFLAFNEGISSRFTNYVRMKDYKPAELREIFMRTLAADFADEGESLSVALERVRKWFAPDALQYMEHVLCSSKQADQNEALVYPLMRSMFKSQARQMVTMGGMGSEMISNSPVRNQLGTNPSGNRAYVLSPHDVFRILSNLIERDEGAEEGAAYLKELTALTQKGRWMNKAGNWGVPDSTAPPCKRDRSLGSNQDPDADDEAEADAEMEPSVESVRRSTRAKK